jgi:hypothetical protein
MPRRPALDVAQVQRPAENGIPNDREEAHRYNLFLVMVNLSEHQLFYLMTCHAYGFVTLQGWLNLFVT